MGDRKHSDGQTPTQEASLLEQVAARVVATLPRLPEMDAQLATTKDTTQNIDGPWSSEELSCTLRVVRYGPGNTYLQASFTRYSVREREGIR